MQMIHKYEKMYIKFNLVLFAKMELFTSGEFKESQ